MATVEALAGGRWGRVPDVLHAASHSRVLLPVYMLAALHAFCFVFLFFLTGEPQGRERATAADGGHRRDAGEAGGGTAYTALKNTRYPRYVCS